MKKGKVKWFDPHKGYGFIVQDDGSDIFVHHSDIVNEGFRSLKQNEEVTYDIGDNGKGQMTAVNVKKMNP